MKSINIYNILYVILIILLLLTLLFFYDKYKKKTISIFGSVSKDISNDFNLQKDLKQLALNLNTSKYDYIIPNSKEGTIGYILNNIKEEDKNSIITTYSTTFHKNNTNDTFKLKIFNDPVDFEEYMIKNSNIFIILPGGVGTFYEIAFLLFLIDVSDVNNKIIFYNKDNYYNFINDIMERYYETGYLRDNVYNKYKSSTYFVNNIDEIIKLM
jgi:predicted Rossmann-fold nucleotide-binding protein